MEQEIFSVLEPQEKIVWQDVINRKVIIFYLITSLVIVFGISFYLFSKETINYSSNNNPQTIAGLTVGLIVLVVGTLNIDTGKVETVQSGGSNNQRSQMRTAYDKLVHINKPYEVYRYFQSTLTGREESLYSGRADKENNPSAYRK